VCSGNGEIFEEEHPGPNCGCLDCRTNIDVTFHVAEGVTFTLPKREAEKVHAELGQVLLDSDLRGREGF